MIGHVLLVIAIASSYVFAIYFAQPPSLRDKDRNDIEVVKHRIKRIIILCSVLLVLIPNLVEGSYLDNIRSLGIIPGYTKTDSLIKDYKIIRESLYFILTLYSSSIYQGLLIRDIEFISRDESILYHIRDHIISPISEELIYRGMIILVVEKYIPNFMVFTPYLFGIAHIHHGIQLYFRQIPIGQILRTSGFQFIYTSIFGIFCNYYYINIAEKNLWSTIVIHMICNFFGFPSLLVDSKDLIHHVMYYSLIIVGIFNTWFVLKNN
ncbi:RCE1 [[Candida] subhashii]|uniref:intramembrane prenyl-peptidase Rce1 n=1 Tax=[Candida] subhashii TaxID=561895 RepID=A0A8J5QTP4_9ASCO|nr:RCE1 [[Candida] subhashii]KAG7666296.1 RCE1 [[Candida] subhashii]